MNPPIELSPPPTPPTLDFCADLDCNPDGCHMVSFPKPSSAISFDRLDFGILCSFILDSTCDVHMDKVMEGVGLEQPTPISCFMSMCGNLKKNLW